MYSSYKRQRINHYYRQGLPAPTILKRLKEERLTATRQGIWKFLNKYEETGTIARSSGSGRPSCITADVKALVEEQMRRDDETTAAQLYALLVREGHAISMSTVLRCRTSLGWTFRGSSYCQLIRHENKQKRLDWARRHLTDGFEDVIWTDECTVQMESHRRFCCRKRGEAPRPKPRYIVQCTYVCTCTCTCTCIYAIKLVL